MQKYRHGRVLLLGLPLAVAGCNVPTQRENLDAAAVLVGGQVGATLDWRLDAEADARARQQVEALLVDGLTLQAAIAVAFLASPDLQIALEELEITRGELVAAATGSNPVFIVGSRTPNGDLSDFYPGRSVSIGVLQSFMDLLKIPSRRKAAQLDLERARHEAADEAVTIAAHVAQAWIDYAAALQVQGLRDRAVAVHEALYGNLQARQGDNPDITNEVLEQQMLGLLDRRADAVRARLDTAKAREQLGQQLGLTGWRDDWTVSQPLPGLPASDPDPVAGEAAAMTRRLDILAGTRAVEARLKVLSHQRRFRWLNQLDLGLFHDEATGGTSFTGPSAVVEVPLLDQRKAALLSADSRLRTEMRTLEATRLTARSEIRTRAAEMAAARELLEQVEQQIPSDQPLGQTDPAGGDPDDYTRFARQIDQLSSEEARVVLLRDYWRARSAMALAVANWGALSGFP